MYIFPPNAQNASGVGQDVDAAVCQQGAAVTYSQEGHKYSGPDSMTDSRGAALPIAGASLNGAYSGEGATGSNQYLINIIL